MEPDQNYIKVEKREMNEVYEAVYFQLGSEETESRKVIDILLDAPAGEDYRITVVASGKTLAFTAGPISVTDIAKTYNGVRIRKTT